MSSQARVAGPILARTDHETIIGGGLHRLQPLQDHLAATAVTVPPPPSTRLPAGHLAATVLLVLESDTDVLVVRCSPGTASAWLARSA